MIAKYRLIDFLKTAPRSDGGIYEFSMWFISETKMDDYIHLMRVELSRIRDQLKDQGKQLRAFKMLVVTKDYNLITKKAKIVMRFRDSLKKEFTAIIDEIFDVVSQGTNVLNDKEIRGLPQEPKKYPNINELRRLNIDVKTE